MKYHSNCVIYCIHITVEAHGCEELKGMMSLILGLLTINIMSHWKLCTIFPSTKVALST